MKRIFQEIGDDEQRQQHREMMEALGSIIERLERIEAALQDE